MELFSVESRKGGVGKTTIALNLGLKLLEMDYKVLLLDCDITGTSISECSENSKYWEETVHVIKKKKDKKDKKEIPVNLLDYFKNYYLVGKEDKWIKKGDKLFDIEKLNVIGSELYDEERLVIDPRVLMDELHSYWVISMLKEISEVFSKSDATRKTAIIIDNSPGYAGMGRAVHEWLSDLGPKHARFLLVSSLDEQDIKSTVYSLKEIRRQVEGKIRVKKYFDQLSANKKLVRLNEKEEDFLKSDDCYDRFFYKLAGGFEYKSNTETDYLLQDYVTIVFNKVSEEYKKTEYDFGIKEILTEEYLNIFVSLFGGYNIESFIGQIIPFDYNIQSQFFSHRLKNIKSGSEKYWVGRFKKMNEKMEQHRKYQDVVNSSFRMDKLIHTLKISMTQKGQGRMADSVKDEWMMGSCLSVFSELVTTIAYYNKPDNKLDLSGLEKKGVMTFNKRSLDLFVKKKGLMEFEPILDSFFDYLYMLAGAKKSARDIRLLVTVSVFCNAIRCIWIKEYKKGEKFPEFLYIQSQKNYSGSALKKYVGNFVPVKDGFTFQTDSFMGVFGKCFDKFYKSVCYALVRMCYRFDNFLLLSDVLAKLILSSRYSEIPSEVEGYLDKMIVEMSMKRDEKKFDDIINNKMKMESFETVIGNILKNQWKL